MDGTHRWWDRLHRQHDLPTQETWGASEEAQRDQADLAQLLSTPPVGGVS